MKKLIALFAFAAATICAGCSEDKETEVPAKSYAVWLADDGHGTAAADPEKAEAGKTITLTATPAEGYEFAAWIVTRGDVQLADPAANPTTFVMPESDVEIKATFVEPEAETYPVTVTAQTGGSVIYDPHVAAAGTIVKMQATPDDGYRFTGWEVEKGGVEIIQTPNPHQAGFVMGEEEVVILARFEEAIYGIAIDPAIEHGKVEVKNGMQSAKEGTIVTLTAIPDDGYKFAGWKLGGYELSDDARRNNPLTIKMPANDLDISAQFNVKTDDVLAQIADPALKTYMTWSMTHAQTVVVNTEYIVNNAVEVETERIEVPAWDTDGDGQLSEDEAAAVRAIDLSKATLEQLAEFDYDGTPVRSLAMEGYFTGLEVLKASEQRIERLDASEFQALKVLVCDHNGLKEIENRKCAQLTTLFVECNELTVLDITPNRELHSISCHTNHLQELNIGSMKFRKDNSYFLRAGCQTDTEGNESSLLLKGMRANQVAYWNDVLTNESLTERQYNRRIGVVY